MPPCSRARLEKPYAPEPVKWLMRSAGVMETMFIEFVSEDCRRSSRRGSLYFWRRCIFSLSLE